MTGFAKDDHGSLETSQASISLLAKQPDYKIHKKGKGKGDPVRDDARTENAWRVARMQSVSSTKMHVYFYQVF